MSGKRRSYFCKSKKSNACSETMDRKQRSYRKPDCDQNKRMTEKVNESDVLYFGTSNETTI